MRYRRAPLIVMLVVATIFLCLNLIAWHYQLAVPTLKHLGTSWYGYGWPAPFARQLEPNLLAALTYDLRGIPFLINLAFALFMTVGSGVICERWMGLRYVTGSFQTPLSADPRK